MPKYTTLYKLELIKYSDLFSLYLKLTNIYMKHLLILLSFLPFVLNAQECNCKSIYNWTKTTFEENDAGFQYIIDIKGKHAYILHNDLISEKAKNSK